MIRSVTHIFSLFFNSHSKWQLMICLTEEKTSLVQRMAKIIGIKRLIGTYYEFANGSNVSSRS